MLRRYVEQILNLYNCIDGIVVVNAKGIIEYFTTYRPDVNKLKEKDLVGRHILEIYPNLTEETSSLLRVLRSGKPISNEFQELSTYDGQSINAVNTTMPIKEGEKIVGAVDFSRYVDFPYERQDITLKLKPQAEEGILYTLDDIVTSDPQMEQVKERLAQLR